MTIEYRTPSKHDVEALSHLGRDTFVATFGHLYTCENLDGFLEQVFHHDLIRSELSNPLFQYRVAVDREQGNQMIGYCKIGPLRVPIVPIGAACEIRQLYVRTPYFGRGVAKAMMLWALGECSARGAQEIYLSVWSGNLRAIRFYERFGFTNVGSYDYMVGDHADHEFIFRRVS